MPTTHHHITVTEHAMTSHHISWLTQQLWHGMRFTQLDMLLLACCHIERYVAIIVRIGQRHTEFGAELSHDVDGTERSDERDLV